MAFVSVGVLEIRGRVLKQVKTLQKTGVRCSLVHGDTSGNKNRRVDFPCEVDFVDVGDRFGPVALFLKQIWFCWVASDLIAAKNPSHLVCIGLESLLAGFFAKLRRRSLVLVFDSNELHVDSYSNPLKKFVWGQLERRLVGSCDTIIHAEENRRNHFCDRYKVDRNRNVVIQNFPNFVGCVAPTLGKCRGQVRVLYVGVLGDDRYSLELCRIFAEIGEGYSLDLVGPAKPEVAREIDQVIALESISNVRRLEQIPYADLSRLIQAYDIGIAFYKNNNLNNYYCAPNKVFDYLMNGLPVVTNNYPGLMKIIEGERVGACVNEVNTVAIVEALDKIVSEMRWLNISDRVRNKYSWESQAEKYLGIFLRVP